MEKFDEKQKIDEEKMLLRQEMKNFLIHYKNVVLTQLESETDCLEKALKGTFMSYIHVNYHQKRSCSNSNFKFFIHLAFLP